MWLFLNKKNIVKLKIGWSQQLIGLSFSNTGTQMERKDTVHFPVPFSHTQKPWVQSVYRCNSIGIVPYILFPLLELNCGSCFQDHSLLFFCFLTFPFILEAGLQSKVEFMNFNYWLIYDFLTYLFRSFSFFLSGIVQLISVNFYDSCEPFMPGNAIYCGCYSLF